MLFSRTIALAITLLASLISADDPKAPDGPIEFHKWGTPDCSSGPGDEVGDADTISAMACYTCWVDPVPHAVLSQRYANPFTHCL